MKPIIPYIFLELFPEIIDALENWLLINCCSAFFRSDLWQPRTVSRPIEFVFAHNEIWELWIVLVIKMLWFYIIGWLPSTLAVFGNALVIFLIAAKRRLHSLPNMFVLSLAVSDFSVGLLFFPTLFFSKKNGTLQDGNPPSCSNTGHLHFGLEFMCNDSRSIHRHNSTFAI